MSKIEGKITRFYNYEKTSGRINVPNIFSEMLGWEHNNEIIMNIEIVNGQKGLFLFKKKK